MQDPYHNQKAGKAGEDIAAKFLEEQGLRVVARNWRWHLGEIDIVAKEGPVLVFCEVKARMSLAYGPPEYAITPRKLARLRRAAGAYLALRRLEDQECRFDAVTILFVNGIPQVSHFRNILSL